MVAVVYAVFLATLFYRELTPGDLVQVLTAVAGNTAKITFIIASAGLYGWLLAREGPRNGWQICSWACRESPGPFSSW